MHCFVCACRVALLPDLHALLLKQTSSSAHISIHGRMEDMQRAITHLTPISKTIRVKRSAKPRPCSTHVRLPLPLDFTSLRSVRALAP